MRSSAWMSGATALVLAGTLPAGRLVPLPIPATPPLVFEKVTVVDVERGKLIPDQRVVIEGTHIRAMGSPEAVKLPSGAQVVNAQGKYLMPGLWDVHVHPFRHAPLAYQLFVANGVTGIRDASSEIPLDTTRRWRREILAGTRVGPPRQILSSEAINGPRINLGAYVGTADPHWVTVDNAVDARRLVDSFKTAGADMIKTYSLSKEIYWAIASEARRVGIPFGGHLSDPELTAVEASDSGARIIDHFGTNSAGEVDTVCAGPTASLAQCTAIAEHFRRHDTWLVLTRNVWGGKGAAAARIVTRLEDATKKFWTGDSLFPGNWLHSVVGDLVADSAGYLATVARAHLPMLAGTDVEGLGRESRWVLQGPFKSPTIGAPGFTLHAELAILVAEGLSPLVALQSATLNPAKMWHATDSLGTVAPGKLADLVLLDADPLADITNTTMIRAVVANGRYFDRSALDGMLRDVQSRAKVKP